METGLSLLGGGLSIVPLFCFIPMVSQLDLHSNDVGIRTLQRFGGLAYNSHVPDGNIKSQDDLMILAQAYSEGARS